MVSNKFAVRALLLILCLAALATGAKAQYRTSIQGVVTDPSGGVVSGATLKLTNIGTGAVLTQTSNDSGVFSFNALPASVKFRLEVEKQGFHKKLIDNVELTPEQANSVDVQLELGTETETVTVDGSTVPAMDTETANISGTVTENQIQHLPSFGRDVFQLLQLAPGVFGDGAQGSNGNGQDLPGTQGPGGTGGNQGIFQTENGPQVLAAGQQYENNGISIDGISTSSAVWGGTTIITPSEDSVESVKVVSNGYDAEDGRFSGAQVQVTSKSGTNDFHGSAFYTAHRPGLNAFQGYNGNNGVTRDDNLFNQYGAGIGGPIWKNKIFFYFNWETVQEPNSVGVGSGWFETSAFDGLAAAGGPIAAQYLNFPGSQINNKGINDFACGAAGLTDAAHATAQNPVNCAEIPGQGLDVGSPLKTGVGKQDLSWASTSNPGVGGGLDGVADIANFNTTSLTTTSKNQYMGRVDYDMTSKDRLSGTIYYVPQSTQFLNGPPRDYNEFHHQQINEAFAGIWNHTFSPTFLNELRGNAAGWRWNEVTDNPQSPVGLPDDSIGQTGSITVGSFGPSVGSILNQWTYTVKDVATKVHGNHTIKFGGELTRLHYLQDCAGCGVPSYQFFNLWSFLNDAPHNESGSFDPGTGVPTTLRQDDRENLWGFFAQDNVKVKRNLTITAGVRYSYYGPLSSKQGNMFQAVPGMGTDFSTGLVVQKGHSWNATQGDVGPQVGFAWSPDRFHSRLVIRGGYGLNYNQNEIAISSNIVNNPGIVVSPNFVSDTPTAINPGILYAVSSNIHSLTGYPANPAATGTFGPNGLPTGATGVNVVVFPTDLPTMHVHHYSADVQYDLGHEWIVSAGYEGSKSYDLYFHVNPNAYSAAVGNELNPQIGGGDYWQNSGYGNYNALLLEGKHQFAKHFMLDAEFQWAKSMDTSSGPYYEQQFVNNPSLNYGRSDYNVGKAFKLYGMWQPVFFHGNNWVEKVVGGWSLSGILNIHSGFPWTPELNTPDGASLYCANCGYTQVLPIYAGGAGTSTSNDAFKTGSNFGGGNGSAFFTAPNFTTFPDSGTFGDAIPGPGIRRNSFTGPGYRDLDMTISKAFGLPRLPILGENAKFEFRMDAYNVFNNLNFNPTSISNTIGNANFGQAQSALAGRVVTLGARFSF